MEEEECYEVCREGKRRLKEKGKQWSLRGWWISVCRKMCRERGMPRLLFYGDEIQF